MRKEAILHSVVLSVLSNIATHRDVLPCSYVLYREDYLLGALYRDMLPLKSQWFYSRVKKASAGLYYGRTRKYILTKFVSFYAFFKLMNVF